MKKVKKKMFKRYEQQCEIDNKSNKHDNVYSKKKRER